MDASLDSEASLGQGSPRGSVDTAYTEDGAATHDGDGASVSLDGDAATALAARQRWRMVRRSIRAGHFKPGGCARCDGGDGGGGGGWRGGGAGGGAGQGRGAARGGGRAAPALVCTHKRRTLP
jgi:hypothetical protein